MKLLAVTVVFAFMAIALAQQKPKGKSFFGNICKQFLRLDCDKVSFMKNKKLCDSNGRQYGSRCEFLQAWCKHRRPTQAPMTDEEAMKMAVGKLTRCSTAEPMLASKGPRHTRPPTLCDKITKDACKTMLKSKNFIVCGTDNVLYRSRCKFEMARCQNPDLRPRVHITACHPNRRRTTMVPVPPQF